MTTSEPTAAPALHLDGDALELITTLAKNAERPMTLDLPGTEKTAVVYGDGKVVRETLRPRRYDAETVGGLAMMIADLASRDGVDDVRVFVGRKRVVAVLNEHTDRHDRVTFELKTDESMETLKDAERNGQYAQKDLIWLLRSQFAGGVAPNNFLPAVRGIKFRNNTSGTAGVQHGNETVDMQIEKSISGLDESGFPETVILSTPVYAQLAAVSDPKPIAVACAVDILIDEQKFRLKPLAGEIERAYVSATNAIVDRLSTLLEGTDVFGSGRVVILPSTVFDLG